MLQKVNLKHRQQTAQLQMDLSRWDNEGGAGPQEPHESRRMPLKNTADIAQMQIQSIVAIH